MNLYGSDQVRDQIGGETVDHYSPLGLLVLCRKQARSVCVYVHRRHVFHEAALIIVNVHIATAFRLSHLETVHSCFFTSRASCSEPMTRSDTHVWNMVRLLVSNSCAGLMVKLG